MMRMALWLLVLWLTLPTSALAQARTFGAEHGMMLNYIKPDRAADFEAVMQRVATALATSADPNHRAMADGWHLLKAREPGPNNSVLFIWWIDPAPPGANYAVSTVLSEYYPDDAQSLYAQFSRAFAGGQAMVNLDSILRFRDLVPDRPMDDTEARRQTDPTEPAGARAAAASEPRPTSASTGARSYTNVDGERVQSPTRAPSRPAGASAQCRDGTYSFSRNRRGTCSGHGGVARWF